MRVKLCFCLFLLFSKLCLAQNEFEKGLFIDRLEALYCDVKASKAVIDYLEEEQFSQAYLYVSKTWFDNYANYSDSLLTAIKALDIEVYAVISPSSMEGEKEDEYAKYLRDFDGFFFEFEFWHLPIKVRDLKKAYRALKARYPEKTYMNYIGWPGETYYSGLPTLKRMARQSKKFAVHMYRKNVDYQYVINRLTALNQIAGELRSVIDINMLYSSEPTYMGELLKEKSLEQIQAEFMIQFKKNNFPHLRMRGALLFKASDLVGY